MYMKHLIMNYMYAIVTQNHMVTFDHKHMQLRIILYSVNCS